MPKAMILNAIVKEVYLAHKPAELNNEEYELPHNLEVFFDGKQRQEWPAKNKAACVLSLYKSIRKDNR